MNEYNFTKDDILEHFDGFTNLWIKFIGEGYKMEHIHPSITCDDTSFTYYEFISIYKKYEFLNRCIEFNMPFFIKPSYAKVLDYNGLGNKIYMITLNEDNTFNIIYIKEDADTVYYNNFIPKGLDNYNMKKVNESLIFSML